MGTHSQQCYACPNYVGLICDELGETQNRSKKAVLRSVPFTFMAQAARRRRPALALHGGRIRATYHHRRDRSAWTGRTTIDPNHSAQVEGDHYLHSHTPAHLDALEAIIEQAQTDLRRKGEPPIILTGAQTAEFAAGFPRLVEQAGLDAAAVDALLAGEQDVFVAACAAPLN